MGENLKNNMRISYIIKEMLKELDKVSGKTPTLEWVKNNIIEISKDEYDKIIQIMLDGHLIFGCSINKVGKENRIFEIDKTMITIKGIEFLNK
ncbi:YjcQ family protein [Clostridium perfringens]|uniref:YjcQ family protein n=1 Tax=Clostridium perfringens TaxID=1502 RepID=UPI001240DF25|nr:YjcQ family protein [Clostridium perfringens]EGT0014187.1 hypothetical protein [Clostridium perfringens]MDU7724892.1 YjcQ family protein [Clostridium perfringens]